MAKIWAKQFYNSKAWLSCRGSFISKRIAIDGGMCEHCKERAGYIVDHIEELTPENINDPNIALNHDNFQYLCLECHNRKTLKKRNKNMKNKRNIAEGIRFTEDGQIERTQVIIVHGSPASGKTTYVKQNKKQNDVVVDLDYISYALSYMTKEQRTNAVLNLSIEIRDYIYQKIVRQEIDADTVWIVATLPTRKERETLQRRLNAELIHIDTNKKECIKNAINDSERTDKDMQIKIIERYWNRFEA